MDEEDDAFDAQGARAERRRKTPRPLTDIELQTMMRDDHPASSVLLRLAESGCLKRLVDDVTLTDRRLHLVVRVLGKALEDTTGAQRQGVADIVEVFKDAELLHDLIGNSFHGRLGTNNEYLKAVLVLLKVTAQSTPNIAAKNLSHIFLLVEDRVDNNFRDDNTLIELKDTVKRLLRQPVRQMNKEEEEERRRAIMREDRDIDPNLFRELSIVPTAVDFDPDADIAVRANKIHGGYDSVNDYLDIQFRLLRADLIMPLRDSVLNYLALHEKRDLRGVRVYSHVRIVRPVCHDKGLCFRLSFDISQLRRVNWAVSQRLKYGSLLCLSADNFATYKFAVVENRESKALAKGLVDVQFIINVHGGDMQLGGHEEFMELINEARDQRYIMVESPTYFEAYKHVLMGLQRFTENDFPFWRYIGECNSRVDQPQYLMEVERPKFDLRPLIDTSFIIKDNQDGEMRFTHQAAEAEEVDILDLESWPNANTLSLDNSQFKALQSALTKEFSIIQGPPGTGKTFIGLMVMKALLHNKRIWIGDENPKPILLVCYTNHALDQFLEGILDFYQGSLVRVGSRSKSEKLEEYNLRGMRNRARENRTVPIDIHVAKSTARIEMKDLKADIHKEAAKLEILEREIVKESFLKGVMREHHYKSLTQGTNGESVIVKWLKITLDVDRLEKKKPPKERRQQGQAPQQVQAGGRQGHIHGGVAAADALPANDGRNRLENSDDEEEDDDDDDDDDLLDMVNANLPQTRHLDVDDDDGDEEGNEDLFAELMADHLDEYLDNVKRVNRKLDETDLEAAILKEKNVAFNISEYGEENMPSRLTKEEKKHWKEMSGWKKRYRTILLSHLQKVERMTEEQVGQVYNVWKQSKNDRWRMYRYWVDLYSRQIRGEIRDKSHLYEQKASRYQEILHQEDKSILEKATIIGMTTTGAARYQGILREIGPKIVLVEEAAEVLEGHVITSLSDRCQHVVLIGDHKQLRPNPSVYELKTKHGLDISLFERLLNNNFEYDCLRYQHRMRPEISLLLRVPDLYPNLLDHDLVKNYPDVARVKGNVCFIHHSEQDQREEETKTFSNPYEARFLVGLCEYLLQQGQFRAEQITILSPYAGQIHYIKSNLESLAKSSPSVRRMKGVKISSVDNYQGEENDIILLSLVRSNVDNEIGFLKANNRICVALSRAKIGLYVFGNFEGLNKSSPLIKDISVVARRHDYLKSHIALTCQRHPKNETVIHKPDDFKKVGEGGCSLRCEMRLECGHSCKRICHTDDMEHKLGECIEQCRHMCDKCEQNCKGGHLCGQHDFCKNQVRKRMPNCGHSQLVPCYLEPNRFECKEKCKEQLPCGHQCGAQCGTRHNHDAQSCRVMVEVTPNGCGHGKFNIECRRARGDYECPEPCGEILNCEHQCQGTCGQCRNGRLHADCKQKCPKILICGHACQDKCDSCPPCTRPCETACVHSRCPKKCGELCQACVEKCSWKCDHQACQELCCQPCERPRCDQPCRNRLPCGHICCGLCGEKCPRLCAVCDKEELIDTSLYGYAGDPTTLFIELDCGHVLEVDFMDQWMTTSTATDEDSDQEVIGLKPCPVCKATLRKCERYNGPIKTQLRLIESVKRKYLGDKRRELQGKLDQAVSNTRGVERTILEAFTAPGDQVISEAILTAQLNQVNLFKQISAVRRLTTECMNRWPNRSGAFREILKDLEHFASWALKKRTTFSEQNTQDTLLEAERLTVLVDLHKIELEISSRGIRDKIPVRNMTLLAQSIRVLSEYKRVQETVLKDSKALYEELKQHVPESHIALTSEEKLQIVQAINVSRGAWYKCPNGHIYAIGDCGQAMEEAKCPECNATIGGTNHQLRTDNAWAQEMDNADQPVVNDLLDADRELAERLHRQLNEGLQGYFF